MTLHKVGTLWKKEKTDSKFLAGPINVLGQDVQLFIFKNKYKASDSDPDYIMYTKVEDDETQEKR